MCTTVFTDFMLPYMEYTKNNCSQKLFYISKQKQEIQFKGVTGIFTHVGESIRAL